MKKYIAVKENANKVTHIKAEVYYSLGGMNYFTYKTERRGYWFAVTPVTLEKCNGYTSEGFVAFSGTKWFLKEVKRKSAKAEAEALAIAEASLRGCVNHVAEKNGLELAEEIA